MIGQTISHYRLVEKLGEGGMGVVYKAEDTTLERTVALKFVASDALQSPEHKTRLVQEARAAAALDHPNVCTVHEIGEAEGYTFIVMAFVSGRSLQEKIAAGPMKIKETLDIVQQIAQGLKAAHGKGVVHRDIKPANIILTEEGVAKIVDFGLAILGGESHLTTAGMTAGTTAYMSPEQAMAETVDHRSDIWSLGALMYEMIAGRPPFQGDYADAIAYSIVNEDPEPLTSLRPGVPVELERIILKALAKSPDERHQNLDELLIDLRKDREDAGAGPASGSAVAAAQPTAPSIAVLPFVNMNRDQESEFFSDGLTEELINALAQVEGLRVVSRTSAFHFKGKSQDIREVGKKLQVSAVLEGSVRRAGTRLRVTAQLVTVADGYHLWSERFDREMRDVFDIQDEISQAIVESLRVQLVSPSPKPLVKKWTRNVEAYNLYLQGRYHVNERSVKALQNAVECFQRAAREDPSYALPHAGLAEAYILQAGGHYADMVPGAALAQAKQAAFQAVELDESCAEAHLALALVHFRADWDWQRSEHEFRRAIEINDRYSTAHHQFAIFLSSQLRFDEALDEIHRAHELDPLSPIINTAVARVLHFARRYDEALEQSLHAVKLNPQFAGAYFDLGLTYLQKQKYQEALEAFQTMGALAGNRGTLLAHRLFVHAARGDRDEALTLLEELTELGRSQRLSPFYLALPHLRLGSLDRGFELLREAFAQREARLVYLQCESAYDPVRSDPRFQELLREMGFSGVQAPAGNTVRTTS